MAFGISGTYYSNDGKWTEFAAPWERRKEALAALPDFALRIIRFYNHGSPGEIGGDNAQALAGMLRNRVVFGGEVELLGCTTAGVEGHFWNPVGGLGLIRRTVMYHTLPLIADVIDGGGGSGPIAQYAGEHWTDNLAGELSRLLPNVTVMGLSGISFPLSRIGDHLGLNTGYKPSGLMADRFRYKNGKLAD